ncbi:alcohol dehydrogenase catalytic domain-containing protein [Actinophytocola sp.]|uniref:alcohol dehydrogenase catalytic domain-containing protein n=1 Tax=Actinophytocola sp. TaxID=1872138 RepID=UPI002ED2F045
MVKAAVLMKQGGRLEVRDISLGEPGPGQVKVRVHAAGVCHSDLSLANGTLLQEVPAVLGHEGAGVVTAVGDGVDRVVVGDHVVLNWSPACRECWFCLRGEPWLCVHADDMAREPYASLDDGTPVYPGLGTAAFAEETVVPAAGVVKVPPSVPMAHAAVLGCAVQTGAGAVFNTARVRADESVVVVGLGGVGLSALQAARAVGAGPIIGVDVSEAKADLAARHGATDFLVAGETTAKAVRKLTGGRGADHAFDCVGLPATIRTSWSASRRGGSVTVVGVGSKANLVEFSALELYWFGRTLHGCVFGSSDPDVEIPRLLGLAEEGKLDLAALVSDTTDLAGVNDAFERFGTGARTIVDFTS